MTRNTKKAAESEPTTEQVPDVEAPKTAAPRLNLKHWWRSVMHPWGGATRDQDFAPMAMLLHLCFMIEFDPSRTVLINELQATFPRSFIDHGLRRLRGLNYITFTDGATIRVLNIPEVCLTAAGDDIPKEETRFLTPRLTQGHEQTQREVALAWLAASGRAKQEG